MVYQVRTATLDDVASIASLVETYSRPGLILPRSAQEIERSIENWVVADSGGLLGAGGLVPYSQSLMEVRSLVVRPAQHRRGIGSAMLCKLIELARQRQARILFALTRAVPFFLRAGFQQTEPGKFPEKVLRDCAPCPFKEQCDEVPVMLSLEASPSPPLHSLTHRDRRSLQCRTPA